MATKSFDSGSSKNRPERNIVTVSASSLLRQSDFGSAQSLPTNISPRHSGIVSSSTNISNSGDCPER